jgi:hypothetical protein
MRASALAFQRGRGEAAARAAKARAWLPRCPVLARRGSLSLPAATRRIGRHAREPVGGRHRRFGSEVPA